MQFKTHFVLASAIVAASASAQPPAVVGPMEHVLISYDGVSLTVGFDSNHTGERKLLDDRGGPSYTGNASVLSGRMINDQYGWLANGFIQLDASQGIWIEVLNATEGLDVYEGGRRPVRDNHTYDAILGTEGSSDRWQWSGLMTHNWYAVDEAGLYEATYRVYVGDAITGEDLGIASGTVTLGFVAIPAPASLSLLASGGLVLNRRRRA